MAPRVRVVNPLSRREVLKFGAYTSVGGVLTPGISLAQAIVTDTKGIDTRDVELTVGGARIPAYEARPEASGRYPIVVAISGFTGNSEHHKDVVRRFAHAGFYAIAPELYHREGGMQGKSFQDMAKVSGGVTRAQYLADIRAAADRAKGQSWARADRLGVTGFCGGGALTLHFSAENPDVTAAVPWYGHVKRVYQDAPGVDAFSLIPKIKVPVLGLYGDKDSGIPTEDVKRFEAELKKTNPNVEFVIYPDAQHALLGRPSAGLPEGRGRGRVEALCRVLRQVPEGLSAPSGGVSPPEQKSHRDAATARWASSRPGSRRGRGSSAPGLPRG